MMLSTYIPCSHKGDKENQELSEVYFSICLLCITFFIFRSYTQTLSDLNTVVG